MKKWHKLGEEKAAWIKNVCLLHISGILWVAAEVVVGASDNVAWNDVGDLRYWIWIRNGQSRQVICPVMDNHIKLMAKLRLYGYAKNQTWKSSLSLGRL